MGFADFCGKNRFLLTRLMRGVTSLLFLLLPAPSISTHTPHARRDLFALLLFALPLISTHTPHARRDNVGTNQYPKSYDFYSHASCEA